MENKKCLKPPTSTGTRFNGRSTFFHGVSMKIYRLNGLTSANSMPIFLEKTHLDAAGITDFGKLSYPSEKSAQVFGEMCIPFLWLNG